MGGFDNVSGCKRINALRASRAVGGHSDLASHTERPNALPANVQGVCEHREGSRVLMPSFPLQSKRLQLDFSILRFSLNFIMSRWKINFDNQHALQIAQSVKNRH
jgi:hypothetical protein